jgi:hypothetical protein
LMAREIKVMGGGGVERLTLFYLMDYPK